MTEASFSGHEKKHLNKRRPEASKVIITNKVAAVQPGAKTLEESENYVSKELNQRN